ncbi:DUF4148 domain-containing protein [Paraburkholderia sp. LEh10]|uniref:DUF4148 domain-containing protein n=1 Tax=Paraburkholderia sp. LEh10 TaxID=2821353 RepID=UPI001AE261EE|nr:DUF4148 domain-containing protein [Paraburkholderia sp. LEh10]MBP0588685.1 DUF4148 domain-containing protein [Paraburkholderia sp. LEh10]
MNLRSLVIAAVMALPVVSFAQSNHPLARADVRAQLIELQRAGYNPATDSTQYPKNLEEAQARIEAQKGAASYGEPSGTTSATGASAKARQVVGLGSVYANP